MRFYNYSLDVILVIVLVGVNYQKEYKDHDPTRTHRQNIQENSNSKWCRSDKCQPCDQKEEGNRFYFVKGKCGCKSKTTIREDVDRPSVKDQ